jgi:hypothetical protein
MNWKLSVGRSAEEFSKHVSIASMTKKPDERPSKK